MQSATEAQIKQLGDQSVWDNGFKCVAVVNEYHSQTCLILSRCVEDSVLYAPECFVGKQVRITGITTSGLFKPVLLVRLDTRMTGVVSRHWARTEKRTSVLNYTEY